MHARALCRTPGRGLRRWRAGGSTLVVRADARAARNELRWRWRSGAPLAAIDVADPGAGDPLTLCIADEGPDGPTLRLAATIPGGGLCERQACWKTSGDGARYRNDAGTPDGVTSMRVRPGAAGGGRVDLKAKGEHIATPALPFAPPVLMRLQRAATGRCWEARFEAPRRNDTSKFQGATR